MSENDFDRIVAAVAVAVMTAMAKQIPSIRIEVGAQVRAWLMAEANHAGPAAKAFGRR